MLRIGTILSGLTLAAALGACSTDKAPISSGTDPAALARDRASILAMAGTYKVRFDMRETVPFLADYKPIPAKVSGGHEVVRVIEDRGSVIRLQHLLVVEDKGKTIVVKHWRQDWSYEPASVLVYKSANCWALKDVAVGARNGMWSQTVWQTDDSPRYGGLGRWAYEDGVARWVSDETLRPLARRDATRHPPYDHYVGTNRHALTPTGWVHEQDNAKIGKRDGANATYVHEVVLNSYDHFDAFPVAAADDYWAKTKDYWADVRVAWDRTIAAKKSIRVQEEAENGTVDGPRLMGLAEDIAAGKTSTPDAATAARTVIGTYGSCQ